MKGTLVSERQFEPDAPPATPPALRVNQYDDLEQALRHMRAAGELGFGIRLENYRGQGSIDSDENAYKWRLVLHMEPPLD